MSPDGRSRGIVGVNWGSSRFRAYRISDVGEVLDEVDAPDGVAGLDRAGMAAAMDALVERWPDHGPIFASGMIGSNIGWTQVPYAPAPASAADLALAATATRIGAADVLLVPGVACRRSVDDAPDVMRGEEVELLGLTPPGEAAHLVVVLPGTHTKWTRVDSGSVSDFFTSISGEIFDRLTGQGLFASTIEGEAQAGERFREGLAHAFERDLGLATLLFGARARVMRGGLEKRDAASYLRGLLVGAELKDAARLLSLSDVDAVAIVGNAPLCALYADALEWLGLRSRSVPSRDACVAGFRALHAAVAGPT